MPSPLASRYPRTNQPSATASFVNLFVAPIPRRQVRRTRTGRKDVHNIGALEAGRLTILFDPLSLQALARAFNITVSTTSSRVVKKSSPRHPFVFLRRETFLKIFLLNRKKKEKRTELFFLLYIYIFVLNIYVKQIVPFLVLFVGSRARPRCLFLRGGSRPDERGRSARG